MEFEHKDKLDSFLASINQCLTDEKNQRIVCFPIEYVSDWDGEKLANENDNLLSSASEIANVYMLFTAPKGENVYRVRYVGKTKKKLARQRIRNHLFKKHDGTGAKLDDVMRHVKSGGSVKISWVTIEPESLRNWAEEELIACHPEADWNRENA